MANQSKPFRFLDLPPELRVRVYSDLFEFEQPLKLDSTSMELWVSYWDKDAVRPCITTGLLTTCKMIHHEATPVLYGNNTFDGNGNRNFLKHIQRYIPHVRRVGMAYSAKTHRHGDFVLLKAAKSLSLLEIPSLYCENYSWSSWSKGDFRQALSMEMGPLFRSLHKSQKKDLDRKNRDVLDVLVISTDWTDGPGKNKIVEKANRYEAEIKEALRKTLK